MRTRTPNAAVALVFGAAIWAASGCEGVAQTPTPTPEPFNPVYVTREAALEEGRDVDIQGEYVGQLSDDKALGVQVIALGEGAFQAVFFPGGLPGAGWDGQTRVILNGQGRRGAIALTAPETPGDLQYLAHDAARFSAVSNGAAAVRDWSATIRRGAIEGRTDDDRTFTAEKVERKSPTLGQAPPEGALVLFDGSNTDHWQGGRLDEERAVLCTDGNDIRTAEPFQDFQAHIEFMLPFRPYARGQGRGNSGVYLADHYEIQVLDSFGLEGLHNECGGLYTKSRPSVNMCLPPLTWQTYDITFRAARRDGEGRKTENARVTLKHNGVVILDDFEIDGKTGGAAGTPEGSPGPLRLQGHGNPLVFRNIWVVKTP